MIDAFALPVEGTETRVNAGAEAYEYMVDFLATNQVRRGTTLAGPPAPTACVACGPGWLPAGCCPPLRCMRVCMPPASPAGGLLAAWLPGQ